MNFKDYIEHEVWIDYRVDLNNREMVANNLWWGDNPQDNSFKATLRIPKPERKVEITEGELSKAFFKTCSVGKELELCECDLIEEIFGRD